MQLNSNNNVYTVPNNSNISLNVTIHRIDNQGHQLEDQKDSFKVIYYKKESSIDKMRESLDRWTSRARYGDIRDLTSNEMRNKQISPSGLNFEEETDYNRWLKDMKKLYQVSNNINNLQLADQVLADSADEHRLPQHDKSLDVSYALHKHGDIINNRSFVEKDITEQKYVATIQSQVQHDNNRREELNASLAVNRTVGESIKSMHIIKPFALKINKNSDNSDFRIKESPHTFEAYNKHENIIAEEMKINKGTEHHKQHLHSAIGDVERLKLSDKQFINDKVNQNPSVEESNSSINISITEPKINAFNSDQQILYNPQAFKPNSINVADNKWPLNRLLNLFETFYIEGVYTRDAITDFTHREQLIFLKIIKTSSNDIPKLIGNTAQITQIANKYFESDNKRKSYKITNNKRFVFRKIKSIMYKNVQDPKSHSKVSKKTRDTKFFHYYFQNAPEYSKLTTRERADVKSLLRTYEESKINVIWKFKRFTTDFSKIFFSLPKEMMNTYYLKKVNVLKFCLEYVNDKSDDFILAEHLPIKSLPRPLTVIKEYMVDFFNSFGEYLKRE